MWWERISVFPTLCMRIRFLTLPRSWVQLNYCHTSIGLSVWLIRSFAVRCIYPLQEFIRSRGKPGSAELRITFHSMISDNNHVRLPSLQSSATRVRIKRCNVDSPLLSAPVNSIQCCKINIKPNVFLCWPISMPPVKLRWSRKEDTEIGIHEFLWWNQSCGDYKGLSTFRSIVP